MKLICIEQPQNPEPKDRPPKIRVGSRYTLFDQFYNGKRWMYELVEDKGFAYDSNLFAACSDIDEREACLNSINSKKD